MALEDFLNEYSRLEGNLKKSGSSPDTILEYESSLDPDELEKLKLCRITRNYCRHHDDYRKFVAVSKEAEDFIRHLNTRIEKEFLHISDKTKKIKSVSLNDNLSTLLDLISKNPTLFIPVVEQDKKTKEQEVIGIINAYTLIQIAASISSRTAKLNKLITPKFQKMMQDFVLAEYDDLLENYDVSDNIVVMKKGKYVGIVNWI